MKKFFAFAAAALMSASMFASREVVPNPADLAAFNPATNAVLCVYFDEQVCNDIILIGDATGWNTTNPAAFVKMRPVTGFDGWYAAGVAKSDAADQKFKPVQLKADGTFAWDFQCGGPDAWVQANPAGGTLDVQSELGGAECGLHYTAAGAYIYYCTYWKGHNTPCAASQDYTIKVYTPECEYVEPTIAGGFDNWEDVNHAMDWDEDENGLYYYFVMENQLPGVGFKIKGGEGWDNPIQKYDAEDDVWYGVNYVKAEGKEVDWHLGEESLIVFYWNDPEIYRYDKCEEPVECDTLNYTVTVTFPACEAATPAIIGSFNGWTSVPMTLVSGTTYTATVRAHCTQAFKFNDVVLGWDNELKDAEDKALDNIPFGEEATITLDYSEGYHWAACGAPTAIENVAVKAAAVKAVENGKLVIIKGEKKFNVLGAQL